MDHTGKSGLFPAFGSQASSIKPSPGFKTDWTMEQPIVFGRGASANRSAERAAVSDRVGPGGSLRKGRERPRSPTPAALKQQQFASQQIGRGYARIPDQKQYSQEQLGRGSAKSPDGQQFGNVFMKSPDEQQFGQQQLSKSVAKSPDQQQFGQQQLSKTVAESPDQQQFGQQQLGKTVAESPDQQQFGQQQLGNGLMRSSDRQQYAQQQTGRGYVKSPGTRQFGQQQTAKGQGRVSDQQQLGQLLGKGYPRSPDQQQSAAQQVGKGTSRTPDQQQTASQPVSRNLGKSPDQQREEEAAKARRLVRFRDEKKSSGVTSLPGTKVGAAARQAFKTAPNVGTGTTSEPGSKSSPAGGNRETTPVRRPDTVMDDSAEMDGPENFTAEAILGVCPDMCPETEREERERKGDLDRFERVDGDRNQTSVDLAVKKYTRTAEKDAVLIRPLHVLKNTMGYLLSLLEREHEDDLLSVHNFLWDRMRAVRMDLRMQHIFGEDAITMHEQMIRFHILAMHELCEYVQGEAGVSEGFNAHLNIEQMNKTSVDLFQMYEDHRKKGVSVHSEAEFRGYYALLKLDKHPGYRVEPAELSLDLAKMAPEIRRSPQVLFAREVARACRGNNYVAFFRLARQATYLQACLMHAHFAKLRTQALASLHSGLLKNQGIPLPTVVDWLGMEGEDIEALIRYHGFSIKYYEEPYMVKEGAFLRKDEDFPTYRSRMVEAKRSAMIADDVQSGRVLQVIPDTGSKLKKLASLGKNDVKDRKPMVVGTIPDVEISIPIKYFVDTVEEDMPDYDEEQPPVVVEIPRSPVVPVIPKVKETPIEEEGKQSKKRPMEELQFEAEEHEKRRLRHEADAAAGRAARQALMAEAQRQEEILRGAARKAEVDIGKQRRWLRKWRRRAVAKALERQQKLERAEAALNTLSLGFPLLKTRVAGGDFMSENDRHAYLEELVEERAVKLQEFWAPVNIPNLVLPILQELNPSNKFLYWNILLSAGGSSVGNWIRTKLSSKRLLKVEEESAVGGELDVKLADERKILLNEEEGSAVGLWYTITEVGWCRSRPDPDASFHGINGLVFVVKADESVSVEHARLHSLVQALPEGVSVPLLVISSEAGYSTSAEAERSLVSRSWDLFLKRDEMSHGKISQHKVIFIGTSLESGPAEKTYFNEEPLVGGIRWLAKLSPVQPQLRPVHTGDLVKEYVDFHLKLQLKMPLADIRPEHCITVFNKALERAADEIKKTAGVIPLNWPPDSRSAKKSEDEERKFFTPLEAWNDKKTLESLFAVLQSCHLPDFPSVPNFDVRDDLFTQKSKLEFVLLKYLSTLEGTSPDNPTTRWEVNRVVQRSCSVDRSRKGTYLVPRWARMFQVLFTTRLLLLNQMIPALVYVGRVDKSPPLEPESFEKCYRPASQVIDNDDSSYKAEPTLDDLIALTDERRTRSSYLEQWIGSPVHQMQTPSTAAADSYRYLKTPTSAAEVGSTLLNSRQGDFDEVQRQDTGSPVSQHVADWLIRSAFEAPKLQLDLTESELLLDDMMHELEISKSSPAGDYPGIGESAEPPHAPDKWNTVEVNGYNDQRSPGDERGYKGSAGTHVTSNKRRILSGRTFELELTESEILLGSLVAEFSSTSSEPNAIFTSNNAQCNGESEHMLGYHRVLSSGSGVTLGIS